MKTILFIAHSSTLAGGGEKSLLDAVLTVHKKLKHRVVVSVPEEGDFTGALIKAKITYELCAQRASIRQPQGNTPSHWEAIAGADSLTEAKKVIDKVQPDLIIINTSVIPWFGYLAKIYNIPVITMVRELHGGKNEFDFLPNDQYYLENMARYSDIIAFNSAYTRSSYNSVLSAKKSFLLYPVITIPDKYTRQISDHPILEHIDNQVSVIVLGNIAPHKNQLEVVKAIEVLVKKHKKTQVKLSIMGPVFKDAYLNTIKQYIADHNLSEYIVFIPFSNDPYPQIIQHDILVMASPHEAFGRVTVEAQLLERLTIGAASAGTLEIIEHQKSGLLYEVKNPSDLASKILWAIDNTSRARVIAQAGRKSSVLRYSASQVYEPFFSNINSLIIEERVRPSAEEMYYHPIFALIERNIYIDAKLNEYARALEDAIEEIAKKQAIIDNGIKARTKRVIKKAIKR